MNSNLKYTYSPTVSYTPNTWLWCSCLPSRNKPTTMVVDFAIVSRIYLGVVPNERTYREHFGATPAVTAAVWEWLVSEELLPPKVLPRHLLWLFFWWKTNALQAQCCQFLGGIDKNTFIKWRDMMEFAVSNLPVVRNDFICCCITNTICKQIDWNDRFEVSNLEIVLQLLSTALISACWKHIHLKRDCGCSSLTDQGCSMRLVFV
jgi:hypothetical protein